MLSTAKSANVGFSQVVQFLAPLANPANAARAENSVYKFGKKIFWVSTVCAQYYGLVGLGLVLGSV